MEFAKNIHCICDLMSSTRKGFHVLANSLEDFMLLVFFLAIGIFLREIEMKFLL